MHLMDDWADTPANILMRLYGLVYHQRDPNPFPSTMEKKLQMLGVTCSHKSITGDGREISVMWIWKSDRLKHFEKDNYYPLDSKIKLLQELVKNSRNWKISAEFYK